PSPRDLAAMLRTSHDAARLRARALGLGSSKGRTRVFEARHRGSNPRPRASAGLLCWCKARSYKPETLGSIPRPRTEGEGSAVGYRPRNPGMRKHWRSTRPPSSTETEERVGARPAATRHAPQGVRFDS